LSRSRTARLYVSCRVVWVSLARWSTPSTSLVTKYCSSVTAVPSFKPLPSQAVWTFPRNVTNPSGISPANCREVCIKVLTSARMPRMELPRGRCKRPPRSARRYRAGDRSPLKRGSTTVSSRCSRRKARSATCTRTRCGRLSAAQARRRRLSAPWSLPLSAVEVELRLLFVESVPMGSEYEPDGLCSLSVEEEGPDEGGDWSRREGRRWRCSRRAPSLGVRAVGACRERDRGDRPRRVAAAARADATAAPPAPRDERPGVSEPGPGAAVSPALADSGEGPWAAASAEATAALRSGAGVPSETAVDASSAASRNTWATWRRCAVSAAGRDSPWVSAPPTPCRLGPDPPTAVGGSRDQWSGVERCHWARATSSGVTPNALCKSRRCRSSSSSDSASTDRLEPGPVGIPPDGAPEEVPTAATRGGPKGGATSGRCPSRGEG